MNDTPDWTPGEGRASASRIRQNLDEMASSVREMEAFLQSASQPVPASGQQPQGGGRRKPGRPKGSKTNPDKLSRQASKRGRGKNARGGAASAPTAEPVPLPAPDFREAVPGIEETPTPVSADGSSAVETPSAPVPAAPPPPPELPTIRAIDLQSLSPVDMLSLAREQGVYARSSIRSCGDIVYDLLVKHSRRGGAVEGAGYYEQAPAFEGGIGEAPVRGGFRGGPAGHLRSPSNGLRPALADVSISTELRDRFDLRPGDHIVCHTRFVPQGPRGAQFEATDIISVNGVEPNRVRNPPSFPSLPVEPASRRLRLRSAAFPSPVLDALELLAPPLFGSRGLILAPRSAFFDVSALFRQAAASIAAANPGAKVMLLRASAPVESLRAAPGSAHTVFATEPDDPPDRAPRMLGLAVDIARREAERGRDVVLLIDSIPAFFGAYGAGLVGLTGGRRGAGAEELALASVRRAFATARSLRDGGSVTVVGLVADPRSDVALPVDIGFVSLLFPLCYWAATLTDGTVFDPNRTHSRLCEPEDPAMAAALRARLAEGNTAGAAKLLASLPPPPVPEAPSIPAFEEPV